MSEYKYKESIKDAVNEVYNASFSDELNRKNELDEVYQKAQAYDEVGKAYEYYSHDTLQFGTAVEDVIDKYESGDRS